MQRQIFSFPKLLIFSLFILMLVSSCKKSSTKPEEQATTFTSHRFSWQKIGFSQLTPSIISVINKNDIWIAGNSGDQFSALHWDGQKLNRVSIIDPIYQFTQKYFSDFVAITDQDIYFADGNIFHSDGHTSQIMYQRDYDHNEFIQTIWMETPADIYAAGRKSLIHFNGRDWTRFPMEGEDPIVDIWGSYPKEGAPAKIIGIVSSSSPIGIHKLITLSHGVIKDTLNWPDDTAARHLWFDNKSPVYVQGADLWTFVNNRWVKVPLDGTGLNALHGSGWNNIFVVGAQGYVAHFNGNNWQSYPQLHDESGEFESVGMKANVVAMAGRFGSKGYLVIGVQEK